MAQEEKETNLKPHFSEALTSVINALKEESKKPLPCSSTHNESEGYTLIE